MNPWSRAEDNERFERDLFERRARAMEPVVVPSLASVLRAANVSSNDHEKRSARGRVMSALAVAAACMAATLTTLPTVGAQRDIAPDDSATMKKTAKTNAPHAVKPAMQTTQASGPMSTFDDGFGSVAASYSVEPAETLLECAPAACFSQARATTADESDPTLTCEHEPTCSFTER